MSLDGNGTYAPPAPEYPAIPNTDILASDFNAIIQDIANALSLALFRDGQAAATANINLGTFKLINLGNGTNPQDATTVLQVFTDPTFTGTDAQGVEVGGTALSVTVLLADFSGVASVVLPANTTGVTAVSSEDSTKLATTEFVQNVAMNTALPDQAGHANEVLYSNGTDAYWDVGLTPFQAALISQMSSTFNGGL